MTFALDSKLYVCFVLYFQCHQLLEEHEETVETFWFESGLEKTLAQFYQYFCIDNVKGKLCFCCC